MERPTPVTGLLTRTNEGGKTEEIHFTGAELSDLAFLKSQLTSSELSQLVVEFTDGEKRRPFRFVDA